MTDPRDEAAADEREDDGDRLPWLEPVEEEERGPSPGKLIAAVLVGLVAIGIIVGGLFWLGNRAGGGGGDGKEEVIASQGNYKMPAPDKGGMKVDDKGTTQVAASDGKEQTGTINQSARPETPVGQPQQNAQQPAPPRPAPAGQPQAQPRPAPAQPARLTGPTIQLGAFDSEAIANAEWRRLSQRFAQLRGLQHAVTTTERNGRTFYRLRAAGNAAPDACRAVRAANVACTVVP